MIKHYHSVEGCYNTTGTNIATSYRDNKFLKMALFAAMAGFTAKRMTVQYLFYNKEAIPTSKTNPECVILAKMDLHKHVTESTKV